MESFLGIRLGLLTAFAESIERLPENLREVSPDFICSVPRVFEKVYAKILSGVAAAPPLRRRIFHWALVVGRQASRLEREGRPHPGRRGHPAAIADRLVFAKLRAALGGRLRFCVSGGAPLAQEIAEFFHAAGILILEGYGLTETCPILASNHPAAYKFGTVGRPFAGIEVRIADDGEILARGANIAQGYYRKPEETAAVFEPDGLVPHRRRRGDRSGRLPQDHRPEEGPDQDLRRELRRAPAHREPSEGRSFREPGPRRGRPAPLSRSRSSR